MVLQKKKKFEKRKSLKAKILMIPANCFMVFKWKKKKEKSSRHKLDIVKSTTGILFHNMIESCDESSWMVKKKGGIEWQKPSNLVVFS